MRLVCWFSCGAASAVATKFALAKAQERGPFDEVSIVYTQVREEHPDNKRFLKDCEHWFGAPINILRNEKYNGSISEVFKQCRYIGGVRGAACTTHLKKEVRKAFERPGDVQVFGYTAEEVSRFDRFIDANNSVNPWAPLIELNIGKAECLGILRKAGVELPAMYRLGYRNNNCLGCVKGGAGYWNKIRVDFPEVFKARAELSRILGARLVKYKGKRIFLDELPPDAGNIVKEIMPECGIACEYAEEFIGDKE